MLEHIIEVVGTFIVDVISRSGYLGVGVLMGLDSANIPIPSEIIMPFAGYLVTTGRFVFWGAVMAGTIGSTVGSLVSYWIGAKGGRKFIEKYGKFVLISKRDLERGDRLFKKWGNAIAFLARVTPVVRTFISLPAGITKMPLVQFAVYTFMGSLLWSLLLVYFGQVVGENYAAVRERFHGVDIVVVVLLGLAFIAWVAHFFYELRQEKKEKAEKENRDE